MASRQVQKSSGAAPPRWRGGAPLAARPRSPLWNAWLCAFGIAGTFIRASSSISRSTSSAPKAASSSSTCSDGEWLTPVSFRTSTIAAGSRAAIRPASWPA